MGRARELTRPEAVPGSSLPVDALEETCRRIRNDQLAGAGNRARSRIELLPGGGLSLNVDAFSLR